MAAYVPPNAGFNGELFFTECGAGDVLFADPNFGAHYPALSRTCHAIRNRYEAELQGRWNKLRNYPPEGGPYLALGQEITVIDTTQNLSAMQKFHRLSQLFEEQGADRVALFGKGYLPCDIQDITRLQETLTQTREHALEQMWQCCAQTRQPLRAVAAQPRRVASVPACQTTEDIHAYLANPDNRAIIIGQTDFDFKQEHLTRYIPPEIGFFTGLRHLSLVTTQIAVLSKIIFNLTLLQELYLDNNQLTDVPVEIGNLPWLLDLRLSNNRLTQLPGSIGALTLLQTLTLQNNHLPKLPVEIGNLTQLKRLYLNDNLLTELPVSIGNLSQLNSLSCSNNRLKELPVSLSKLSQLQHLNLSRNQLKKIPIDIGDLTLLKGLELGDNKLTELPESIGNLHQLSWLNCSNNRLTQWPESIGHLKQLRAIHCDNNQLAKLPESISNLSRLDFLSLCHNRLRELPTSMGNLSQLSTLTLTHNQLTDVPTAVLLLPKLCLYLTGNPCEDTPHKPCILS